MDPKRLGIADSVLRELEVLELLSEAPVPCSEPPVCISVSKEVIVEVEPEIEIQSHAKIDLVKTPFLACIQYDCLQNSSDVIYKLIKAVKEASSNHGEKHERENLNSIPSIIEKIESSQGQRLLELSEWRQRLILKLSSYDPKGMIQIDSDVPNTSCNEEDRLSQEC